jgi:tetratricopeptide (TPR) repeat protein
MPTTQERTPAAQRRSSRAGFGRALHTWHVPPLPRRFGTSGAKRRQAQASWPELGDLAKSRLSGTADKHTRAGLELSLIDWLHDTIRLNIKRGHLFEIDRVLNEAQADCLGYARLFQHLGKRLGLDTGTVEVVIDNAGRMVPHVINIARLSDKRTRFIDLWYGSKNVHHRRLGLMVKQKGRWSIVDVDRRELRRFTELKGLPPRCIDAIADYMIGNRHLERGIRLSDGNEFHDAIRCYTGAIARYPQNARLHFNRAVAYENLGNDKAAEADYAVALRNKADRIRVQAKQHDEVVRLIALDQIAVGARNQEMYLLRKGFITGREVSPERIAARYHVSADEVNRITSHIEAQLLSMDFPSLNQQNTS